MSEKEMSFVEHLGELRKALIISLVSIGITSGVCFYFYEKILYILTCQIKNIEFIFVSPGEAFISSLQASVIFGFFLSLPIVLREIFWFISPGLTSYERKISIPTIIGSYFLFLIGITFAYFILLPVGVKFLINFAPINIKPMISIGRYISFASMLILGTAIIFELPLVLLFLSLLGIVNTEFLKKNRKYALFISFLIGAIITPSVDIFTQSLLAGVIILLYELSIFLVWISTRGKNKI